MIQLGAKGRDIITGFEGVAIGYVSYLTGCNQVLLIPRVGDDGRRPEGEWFDEQRVEVLDAQPIRLLSDERETQAPMRALGPDKPAPKR